MNFATLMARNRDGVRKLETIGEHFEPDLHRWVGGSGGVHDIVLHSFVLIEHACLLGLHYDERDLEAPVHFCSDTVQLSTVRSSGMQWATRVDGDCGVSLLALCGVL